MPVTQEEGGRLNAFAREPKIQLIEQGGSPNHSYRLILFAGTLILVALIVFGINIT